MCLVSQFLHLVLFLFVFAVAEQGTHVDCLMDRGACVPGSHRTITIKESA